MRRKEGGKKGRKEGGRERENIYHCNGLSKEGHRETSAFSHQPLGGINNTIMNRPHVQDYRWGGHWKVLS